MFEFEKVCREVEKMDTLSYSVILAEKSKEVIAGLKDLELNGIEAMTVYAGLIFGAVVSDGKLDENEFALIKPMLDISLGYDFSYEEARSLLKYYKKDSKEYNQYVDAVVDLFGEISDELKADIVTVCLLVCGIDGKISHKEKKWLKQLIH